MSPDQAIASTTSPETRLSAYSLPVNWRTIPASTRLLHLRDRVRELAVGDRPRVVAELEQGEADRVAHLRQVGDLALPLRVPEGRHGGQLAGDLLVVAQAGHAGLPRGVVLVVRVEVRADVGILEVVDIVRDDRLVELLEPAQANEPGGHPLGQRDQVPARVLAGLERRLDRAEELLVVVDHLGVVDLGAVLRRELLEACVLGGVVVVGVDVQRPVGEVEDVGGGGLLGGRGDGRGAARGGRRRSRGRRRRGGGRGAGAAGAARGQECAHPREACALQESPARDR